MTEGEFILKKIILLLFSVVLLTGYICPAQAVYAEENVDGTERAEEEKLFGIPADIYANMDSTLIEYIMANVPEGAAWAAEGNAPGGLYMEYRNLDADQWHAIGDWGNWGEFGIYTFTYTEDGRYKAVIIADYEAMKGVYRDDELTVYTGMDKHSTVESMEPLVYENRWRYDSFEDKGSGKVYQLNSETDAWEYKKSVTINTFFDEKGGEWAMRLSGHDWYTNDINDKLRCIFMVKAEVPDSLVGNEYTQGTYYGIENHLERENVVIFFKTWSVYIFGWKWIKVIAGILVAALAAVCIVRKLMHIKQVKKMTVNRVKEKQSE